MQKYMHDKHQNSQLCENHHSGGNLGKRVSQKNPDFKDMIGNKDLKVI